MINPTEKQEVVFKFDANKTGLTMVNMWYLLKTKDPKVASEIKMGVTDDGNTWQNQDGTIVDDTTSKSISPSIKLIKDAYVFPSLIGWPNSQDLGVVRVTYIDNKTSALDYVQFNRSTGGLVHDFPVQFSKDQLEKYFGTDVKVSADGTFLVMPDASTNTLFFVSTKDGSVITTKQMPTSPIKVDFSGDGKKLAVSLFDGSVEIWGLPK